MKKILNILVITLTLLFTTSFIGFGCGTQIKKTDSPVAYALEEYSNYYLYSSDESGKETFEASGIVFVDAVQGQTLEKKDDIKDKLTLGGAFKNMRVERAGYQEDEDEEYVCVTAVLKGELADGDIGTISGEGIVVGYNTPVNVPIANAELTNNGILEEGNLEHVIYLNVDKCSFAKELKPEYVKLSGAAKYLTVKSFEVENEDLGFYQTAKLVLSGNLTEATTLISR